MYEMRYALRVRYEIVKFTSGVDRKEVDQRKEDDNRQELKLTTSHDVTSTSHILLVREHQHHQTLGLI